MATCPCLPLLIATCTSPPPFSKGEEGDFIDSGFQTLGNHKRLLMEEILIKSLNIPFDKFKGRLASDFCL
jgi:hypothetical protein